MYPVFEQGGGRGIGHDLDDFMSRFDNICREHLEEKRATAFAFIFYDFEDAAMKKILHDLGVFAKLDRLAGSHLSLFYLHDGEKEANHRFNARFLDMLGVESASAPCVVFFRVENGSIRDMEFVPLSSPDLIHGFHELYTVVERFLADPPVSSSRNSRYLQVIKSGAEFTAVEGFRMLLKEGIETGHPVQHLLRLFGR